MSWWDTSLTNMASSAIKSAQKKIDNVLDIKDDELSRKGASKSAKKTGSAMKKSGTGDDFWNAYLDSGASASTSPSQPSSSAKKDKPEDETPKPVKQDRQTSEQESKQMPDDKSAADGDDDGSWAMSASGMGGGGWGTWSFSGFTFGAEPVSGDAKSPETKQIERKETDVKKSEKKDADLKKSAQKERPKRSSRSSLTRSGSEKEVDVQKWVDSHDSGKLPDELEKGHEFEIDKITSHKVLVPDPIAREEVGDVFPLSDKRDVLKPEELPVAPEKSLLDSDKDDIVELKTSDTIGSNISECLPCVSTDYEMKQVETVTVVPEAEEQMPIVSLDIEPKDPSDDCDRTEGDTSDECVIENVPERLRKPLVVQIDDLYDEVDVKQGDNDQSTSVTDEPEPAVDSDLNVKESIGEVQTNFGAIAPNQMESTGLWEDADLELPADMLGSVDDIEQEVTPTPVIENVGNTSLEIKSSTTVESVTGKDCFDGQVEEIEKSEMGVCEDSSDDNKIKLDMDKSSDPGQIPLPVCLYPKEMEDTTSSDVNVSVEFPPDTQKIEETIPDEEQIQDISDQVTVCDVEESVTLGDKSDSKELVNSSDSTTSSSGKLSLDMNTSRDTETDVSTDTLKDGECEESDEYDHDDDVKTTVESKMEESTISMASSVSSGSFVKCMLEEAMAEPEVKHEDIESHSTSSDRSSDMVKIDSGHTSGDEIDTTTSSDIEIISTPTSNGDRIDRPFDLSPLRHALSRTVRRVSPPHGQTHKRTDSNSSSSGHSKGSDLEQLSPGREYGAKGRERTKSGGDRGRLQKLVGPDAGDLDELESENNPLQSDKLLKKGTVYEEVLNEKLAETAEILEAREKKVLELSRDVMDLREANNILRQQLLQSEEARETEMTDLSSLTEEFTIRLSEQEKKLQAAVKDRDNMKKQLTAVQEELVRNSDMWAEDKKSQKLLEEKDEQIAGLLMEGEKLSKQQLLSNNSIKKLRVKEKDTDTIIKSQKQKLESQEIELEHLRKVLDSRDETEANQTIAINQLTSAVKYQEKEIEKFKSELEDASEKNRGLQATLDNAYKEIAELNRANATRDSKAHEMALGVELQAREDLKLQLDRQIHRSKHESFSLVHQIEDLQLSLTRMEKECGRREDVLKQEISDLHMRLQEAEGRNEELSQSVSAATRPLLRQIENLQSTYGAQSRNWEKVERNLTDRLGDAQTQVAEISERERLKNEKVIEFSSRVTALESQVGTLRQEKSKLLANLEMERAKLEVLEDTKHKDGIQVEIMKQNLSRELSEVKKEKLLLENQLEMEKMKLETEKKKLALVHDQIKERDRQSALVAKSSPSPVPQMTRSSSQSSDHSSVFFPPVTQDDILERTLMLTSANGSKMNLYDSLRQNGAANLFENLQSQLKLKEGEIVQLQSDITDLERTRESMARELVNLTNQNEELLEKSEEFSTLSEDYKALDKRYDALLQMYGEKDEEVQELTLDLRDIKDLYKTQIQELLSSR